MADKSVTQMWFQNPGGRIFLLLSLVLLGAGILPLVFCDKGDVVIWLNRMHNPFADRFFAVITWLGSGWFYLLVVVYFLLRSKRWAWVSALSFITTGGIVQLMKKLVFKDWMRPAALLKGQTTLHFVDGVDILYHHAFPSGHTATAFSVFLILSLYFRKTAPGVLCFLLALLTGVSRIYLVQHFYMDVYFGMLTGLVTTLSVWFLLNRFAFKMKYAGP